MEYKVSDLYTDPKILDALNIITLKERNWDSYDFHDIHVGQLQWLIDYVFDKGYSAGYSHGVNEPDGWW